MKKDFGAVACKSTRGMNEIRGLRVQQDPVKIESQGCEIYLCCAVLCVDKQAYQGGFQSKNEPEDI